MNRDIKGAITYSNLYPTATFSKHESVDHTKSNKNVTTEHSTLTFDVL